VNSTTSEIINLRYNIKDGTWWVRTTPSRARWFTWRRDNTLTIGSEKAILKYPEIGVYQDEIASNGTLSDIGIETRMLLNLGTLSTLPNGASIYEIEIDCEGESTTGNELFRVKLHPRGEDIMDAHGVPIDTVFSDRPIRMPRIGQLRDAYLEISLPEDIQHLFGRWEISTITVWIVPSSTKTA